MITSDSSSKSSGDNASRRRQADTLALVAAGLANATIAEQLYVSVRTVESHMSSLLAKLGARTEPSSPSATGTAAT